MRWFASLSHFVLAAVVGIGVMLVAVDYAEARRGGAFGSRGLRTFDRPAPTRTQPNQARPVDRSMTPRQQTNQPGTNAPQNRAANQQTQRPGLFGGMMGGLLGGLMLGGLIGMLMGNGLGGMAGFLGLLLQVGLVVLVVMLVMRFLKSRRQPAFAGPNPGPNPSQGPMRFDAGTAPSGGQARAAQSPAPAADDMAPSGGQDDIGITNADLDAFEQLLHEIQAAYAREDFAALRERCTPEIVSFLSEELSQNAVNGVRNDVRDVSLLAGDLSEAWREDDLEYATVAMRYESIDIMRDRNTGDIVDGDEVPTETTEIWTFVRPVGGTWQLSAIQE
ncbi:MAG: TIM44-like domain-containing protein [Pseudomonadota bacterium]